MTTWISINRHTIVGNAKHGRNDPPIRIAKGKHGKPVYAHAVQISGASELIYSPHKPILPCGARLAIRTDAAIVIIRDGE
jgi:hypothetical protein